MDMDNPMVQVIWITVPSAVFCLSVLLYMPQYTGLRGGVLLWLGAWAAAGVEEYLRYRALGSDGFAVHAFGGPVVSVAARMLAIVLGGSLASRFWARWRVARRLDDPGVPGHVNERLDHRDVLLGVGVAILVWMGFGYAFWAVLAVVGAALLVGSAAVTASGGGRAADATVERASEPERILTLLENGGITSEQAGEMLRAVGSSRRPGLSLREPGRGLLLLGVLLVVVGFVLPWYRVDVGELVPGRGAMRSEAVVEALEAFGALNVAGSGVAGGVGWAVLLLAVAAAVLGFVTSDESGRARPAALLAPLIAGVVLMAYVSTRNPDHVSFGLAVVLGGYVLEYIGAAKALRSRADGAEQTG